MADERSVLRWVSWRDCCPWLVLFRTFLISISVRALLLATLGAVLVSFGWWLLGLLLLDREAVQPELRAVVARYEAWPGQVVEVLPVDAAGGIGVAHVLSGQPVYGVWHRISEPVIQWFNPHHGFRPLAYFLLGGVWTVAVWAFAGGALSRIGMVQLGREERVGLIESVTYARKRYLSYLGGPLFPIVGILLLAIPIFLLALIMRLDVGVVLGGLVWLLVILDGLLMAILALGLLFGWPLMWGTISAEGSDAFDSLSRCFAYTFQRPFHYAFYILVTALLGTLCWQIVSFFAHLVIHLTFWAAAWGAGEARIQPIQAMEMPPGLVMAHEGAIVLRTDWPAGEHSRVYSTGAHLIAFWVGCVRAIAASWWYAFFFIAMAGVYLLIRRDVDQTETDEVFLEEEDETYGLPPLTTDESGVPKVTDMPDGPADQKPTSAKGAPPSGGDAPPA